ncbi:hypothetical protein [Lacipirellula sp.]|uniref:hypothetical protein n=1 Tax=Lacipirellula sp. TaxID=2691419 RepID=UPI003D1221C4
MADEMRLPEELAAFEALLAARSLPASRLDRDQVMYRAGWAACEAQLQPRALPGGRHALPEEVAVAKGYPRAEPGGTRELRHTVAWSCASAALAATLAVAVTLGWLRLEQSELAEAEHAGGETPRLAADPSAATAVAQATGDRNVTTPSLLSELDRFLAADARNARPTLAGPWFALHRLDRSAPASHNDQIAGDAEATPSAPKTIRDLQQELLPADPAPPRVVWPWERTPSGDSI